MCVIVPSRHVIVNPQEHKKGADARRCRFPVIGIVMSPTVTAAFIPVITYKKDCSGAPENTFGGHQYPCTFLGHFSKRGKKTAQIEICYQ
jgi:hypothetical protein